MTAPSIGKEPGLEERSEEVEKIQRVREEGPQIIILPFIQPTLTGPLKTPGTVPVIKDPATSQAPPHCKLWALRLGNPAMSL